MARALMYNIITASRPENIPFAFGVDSLENTWAGVHRHGAETCRLETKRVVLVGLSCQGFVNLIHRKRTDIE
jgi:hypothetical protein